MANELQTMAQSALGALPAKLREKLQSGVKINEALGAGITAGFAVVSVRGKVWRIKYQGEERPLLNPDRTPMPFLDVVIVKAAPAIAKIFYINGYEEGSNDPPDCWSVNGATPDPAAPRRQSPTCAGCPQNAWGSAARNGRPSKGKACADSKRLAVVPQGDIKNEMYGGPMLMRVPPASLGDLKLYADSLNQMGYAAEGVVTRIGFDFEAEYPALTFQPLRALNDDEYALVEQHLAGQVVDRILNTAVDHVQTDGPQPGQQAQGQLAQGQQPLPQQAVDTGRPVQQPQQPPPNLAVVGGTAVQSAVTAPAAQASAAAFSSAPPAPAPAAPTPAQASAQRVAEVEQKVTGDPNAAKRAELRKLGFNEEQIVALLGPEPQPEPEPDPRIAELRKQGFSEEQIAMVLAMDRNPGGNTAPAVAPATATAPLAPAPAQQTRKRRTRAQIDAENAAKAGQPAQQAPQQPAAANGGAFHSEGGQPLTGEILPPAGSSGAPEANPANDNEPAPGTLPANFEATLDQLLGGVKPAQ